LERDSHGGLLWLVVLLLWFLRARVLLAPGLRGRPTDQASLFRFLGASASLLSCLDAATMLLATTSRPLGLQLLLLLWLVAILRVV